MVNRSGANETKTPRFAGAALTTFATRLAVAVLSFGSILVIARALGPEGRGDVALLTAIATLSSQLAVLGVDEANVNLAAAVPERRPTLATNSVVLSAVFGALAIGILLPLFAVFPGLGGETEAGLRLVALAAIPGLILQTYLTFLIRGQFGFGITNVSWLASPAITFVANVAFWLAGALSVTSAFSIWVLAHIATVLLLVWYVARRGSGFGRPQLALARRSLGFGLRSHVGRMMMSGNYRADQWFVGAIAGSRELGLYNIAVAGAEVLFYVPTVLVLVQRPFLVRADRAEARRLTAKGFRTGIVLTAPLVLVGVVFAPFLTVTIFGADFEGAVDDLRILLIGVFGLLALQQLGNALTAQGRPGLWASAAAVTFAAMVALDILLIPPFGGEGAAIASRVAYTLGGAVAIVFFLRFFGGPASALVPRLSEVPEYGRTLVRTVRRRRGGTG
jgi:O-antigen/teichoic acid export membrane protein